MPIPPWPPSTGRTGAAAKVWFDENGSWLHPGRTNLLEVDTEAKSLGVPFDAADFLPKTIAALRDEKTRAAASAVLSRYAPAGPGAGASADVWENWWQQNSPYLFYLRVGMLSLGTSIPSPKNAAFPPKTFVDRSARTFLKQSELLREGQFHSGVILRSRKPRSQL